MSSRYLIVGVRDVVLLPVSRRKSRTDFGKPGYGGACHRYRFTIYALKTERLPLDREASAAMVGFYLNANKLDSC
ncbi:hypothetical protein GMLC_36220 [Geomonas limicola]|uniref:Uncharacterized protein n=1 Tax=Geomonas limicola TaxID=2740186 RepID=A0A6V8NEP3_9BACT|nr:hypothetical protein [Geomonas limicola]GFO70043.1 hypothetical protein GMLC_36220 [Geomonas limicola]